MQTEYGGGGTGGGKETKEGRADHKSRVCPDGRDWRKQQNGGTLEMRTSMQTYKRVLVIRKECTQKKKKTQKNPAGEEK